ncbi:MAG: hypothetical protein WD078_01950 [Woeseia sp.]
MDEQRQEHSRSYYAATLTEITVYPELEGSRSADVCIVGGGFTGIASALARSINPLDVAVCDLNRVVDYYRLS